MPPLENIKHEMFAREVVKEKGNISQAYNNVYETPVITSARESASRLMSTNLNVRQRVIDLMNKGGLALGNLQESLRTCVMDDDKRIKLDATKFGFKLHGAIDADATPTSTHQHIHLHAQELSSMTDEDKLAKLRDLLA